MSNIVPFDFEGQAVRVIERDGEPWFVLADVCRVLEIGNPSDAAKRLDDDERDALDIIDPMGRPQNATVINESGLYSLILTSRKQAAKRFKKWVTADVLPTIRKTGGYAAAPTLPDLSDPILLQSLLLEHTAKRIEAEKRAAVAERKVEEAAPKAAFYDAFANADGLYTLQNAGRLLGQGPNKFVQWLKREFVFYQGTALVPYRRFVELGVFEVKCAMVDDKARSQTYVTPKGVQYLARKLGVTPPMVPPSAAVVQQGSLGL